MADRTRIVTPYTDPDRFASAEKALFDQGTCCWEVGGGDPRFDRYCGQPSKPGASFGYCAQHEQALLECHWPDGSPR
jgi:hypothetical protein